MLGAQVQNCQSGLVLVRALFWVQTSDFFLCIHMVEREQTSPLVSSYKVIHEGSILIT
jgi:hypothetical protein